MARNRGGLLAQIAGDVADQSVPLSSLLQNCIVLGGQAGSERMRAWASQELHGYAGMETVPEYRHVTAPLTARITNMAGRNAITQRFDDSVFNSQIREIIREKVDVRDAVLPFGIGQLEEMAGEDRDQDLSPEWAGFIADMLNEYHMAPGSRVSDVYWSVPRSAVRGILVRIRTALSELIAELIALTPQDQEVPDKQAADEVVQFVVTGDRSVITYNYIVQHAAGDGANVAVANGAVAGPVAVSSGDVTAIGSQTASGANSSVAGSQTASGTDSSVVGGQSARASGDVVTAGQDAAVPPAGKQPVKEGWWARLRKRGAVVAFATIIGALAGVAGVVIAIMVAAGWKP